MEAHTGKEVHKGHKKTSVSLLMWGGGYSITGGATPGKLVVGCRRKQTERASKEHSSMASALPSATRFLS